jgi:hypothetical protein
MNAPRFSRNIPVPHTIVDESLVLPSGRHLIRDLCQLARSPYRVVYTNSLFFFCECILYVLLYVQLYEVKNIHQDVFLYNSLNLRLST